MVSNGLEAVDAASRFRYDAICMDVQMPEMDGLEATHLIRSLGEPIASIPIIALTANAFPEDVRACFAAGMNQFVAKPVNRETLLTALMHALFERTNAGRERSPEQPGDSVAVLNTAPNAPRPPAFRRGNSRRIRNGLFRWG